MDSAILLPREEKELSVEKMYEREKSINSFSSLEQDVVFGCRGENGYIRLS